LVIAISKADVVPKSKIDPIYLDLQEKFPQKKISVVSAKTGLGIKGLKKTLVDLLPEGPLLYPEDSLTDQSLRVIASEFIREAIFRLTRNELPYSTAVTIDDYKEPNFENQRTKTYIAATIHVEKDNQKLIIIGKKGKMLQNIGTQARENIEKLVGGPVYLELFVRITHNWTKNKNHIKDFGYGDFS
jgi:GTP-binding protein Era